MIYALIILTSASVCFALCVYLFGRAHEPVFSDEKDLIEQVKCVERAGRGISLINSRRTLMKTYKKLANKTTPLYSFEKWIYDNYYELLKGCLRIDFKNLPHTEGRPRIYSIMKYAVNKNYDSDSERMINFLKRVSKAVKLQHNEISAISSALVLAEISRVCEACKYSIRYEKEKKSIKENRELYGKTNSYLTFYSDKFEVDDMYVSSVTEARRAFASELIYLEQITSTSIKSIKTSYKYSLEKMFGILSEIDYIFSSTENYQNVSLPTRREYAKRVNYLSDKLDAPEIGIAEVAIYLSNSTGKDIGSVLFDKKLLLNYVKRGKISFYTSYKKYFYLLTVFAFTLAVSLIPIYIEVTLLNVVFSVILFVCSLKPCESLIKRFYSISKKPPVMSMAYKKLPDGAETVVVVPQFVDGVERLMEGFEKAETLSCNCYDEKVAYCLLVDLPKSREERRKEDEEIYDAAKKLSNKNARVRVYIRKRREEDGVFLAKERKRGALLDMFESIMTNDLSKFDVFGEPLSERVFAIVLDEDNEILPECVMNAVNTILHPYNDKYDLMTFGAKINKYSLTTEYSKRFTEDGSIDCYPCYNDFYSDVFDLATFCGKGIIRISRFYDKVKDAFPDKRILSHDLIEGATVKSGSLKQSIFEEAPASFKAEASRKFRWQRGDVLLLPYLANRVRDKNGEYRSNNIDVIYKLILLINALEPIRKCFLLLLAFLACFTKTYYLLSVLFFSQFSPYLQTILTMSFGIVKGVRVRYVLRDVFRTLSHVMEDVFFLPFYAYSGIRIFLGTLFSSLFSKRSLLNWTPYRSTQNKSGFFAYVKLFAPSKIMMSVLGVLSLDPYFIAFAGVYVLYAFIIYKRDREVKTNKEEETVLDDVAGSTYEYFSHIRENGLPRDNLQLKPKCVPTVMTSPTDIGFTILADICAIRLGLISTNEGDKKIEETLKSLSALERFKGHFYNWYDVETRLPMSPKCVSSADSANLAACLYVAREYFKRKGDDKNVIAVENLLRMDHTLMYDAERDLIRIAYYPDNDEYAGYYDILESEARLAYYLGIANGLPLSSWFSLDRSYIAFGGNTTLSWYGSLFEYLMPSIFINPPYSSAQARTERNAFRLQLKKAKNGIFGLSECAYRDLDNSARFKYRPHGLNDLAMDPEKSSEVYSPYSACLALPYSKGEVGRCLRGYILKGGLFNYGFADSVDNTPLSIFMTHHQGMILAAITNKLKDDYVRKLFDSAAEIRSVKLLTAEPYQKRKSKWKKPQTRLETKQCKEVCGQIDSPLANILTNGVFSSLNTADGRTKINLGEICLAPVYDDPQRTNGRRVLLKREGEDSFKELFRKGRCVLTGNTFERMDDNASEKVKMLPETNGEIRRIRIKGDTSGVCEIGYYADISLCTLDETYSHKAYYDLFVHSELYDGGAIYSRKNRDIPCAIIKVFGLENPYVNTNKINVLTRNEPFGRDGLKRVEENEFPVEGDVLYPCFATKGSLVIEENESKDIFVLTAFGENAEECKRIADRYDVEKLTSAFDIFDANHSGVISEEANANFHKEAAELYYKIMTYSFSEEYLNDFKFDGKYRICYQRKNSKMKPQEAKTAVALLKYSGFDAVLHTKEESVFGLNAETSNVIDGKFYHVFGEDVKIAETIKTSPIINRRQEPVGIKSGEGCFYEGKYRIIPRGKETSRPYSNVLYGNGCGVIVTENGGGFSFGDNSRQKKIGVWYNDEFEDTRSERVILFYNNKAYDLISSAANCEYERDKAIYKNIIDDVRFTVEIKVEGGKIIKTVKCIADKNENYAIAFGIRASLDWKPSRSVYAKVKECGKMVLFNKESGYETTFVLKNGTPFAGEENLIKAVKGEPFSWSSGMFGLYVFGEVKEGSLSKYDFIIQAGKEDKSKAVSDRLRIETENEYLNVLFNECLFKQIYDCRFKAKASFYQCGGGFGFRDQLQDSASILYTREKETLSHILTCAARQYEEGDVMHWWHTPRTGVRTKNSDDRFFLCFAVARYIDKTGDVGLLNREIPFITSQPLNEGELSRYEVPTLKRKGEPIREHLKRAFKSGFDFGEHDLIKVGSGDWNDGLDKLGIKGKGESVWLSMFAYLTAVKCLDYFDPDFKKHLINNLERLKRGINKAFKGDRFIAYYDDEGEELGTVDSPYCKLYLLTQAFAVFSGAVEDNVCNVALSTAMKLFDKENDLVKIFDIPFGEKGKYGYISAYPKGVRENGGQYTHAAVWFAKALFDIGRADEGYKILCALNPVERCSTLAQSSKYAAEPYVLSADVYADRYAGRAGWSWYTGSASWYYITIVESMFGLKFTKGKMYFEPNLPSEMKTAKMRYLLNGTEYRIEIVRSNKNDTTINGKRYFQKYIQPVKNAGTVDIKVEYREKERDKNEVTVI